MEGGRERGEERETVRFCKMFPTIKPKYQKTFRDIQTNAAVCMSHNLKLTQNQP